MIVDPDDRPSGKQKQRGDGRFDDESGDVFLRPRLVDYERDGARDECPGPRRAKNYGRIAVADHDDGKAHCDEEAAVGCPHFGEAETSGNLQSDRSADLLWEDQAEASGDNRENRTDIPCPVHGGILPDRTSDRGLAQGRVRAAVFEHGGCRPLDRTCRSM